MSISDIELLLSGPVPAGKLIRTYHSDETRKKLSDSKKGKEVSAETRAKISALHKGKKRSAKTCEAMSRAKTGRTRPDWVKAKISETKRVTAPRGASHARSKGVITPWGKFDSMGEAGRHIPISKDTLRDRIRKGVLGYEYA